jgi:RNA polymerase sigma-70 factor (ECF subfamily)
MMHVTMNDSLASLLAERAWLAGLARTLVQGSADADDLVQDTWTAAIPRALTLVRPRAWLAAVARQRASERARSETRRRSRERRAAQPEASAAAGPEDVVARFDLQRRVAEAVHQLDEPFRTTVLLHHFEGLALVEVARRQQVPEGTVRWRLHRAHALLRARLQASIGDDWRQALLPLCGGLGRGARRAVLAVAALVVVGAGSAAFLLRGDRDGRANLVVPRAAAAAAAPIDATTSGRSPARTEVRDEPAATDEGALTDVPRQIAPADQRAILRLRLVDDAGRGVAGPPLPWCTLRCATAP